MLCFHARARPAESVVAMLLTFNIQVPADNVKARDRDRQEGVK